MEEAETELQISVTKDESGYGFSITGVTTFSVSKVTESGAAERAGLKVNDVIRRINGLLPRGNNKIVHKMITASARVDLVITRKIFRPVESMNNSSNGQFRLMNDNQVTDDLRTLTRKVDPCIQSSDNAARNIPESLPLTLTQTSVGDETDSNLHSSKQTPSSLQDFVVAPATLHAVASSSDLKSLAEPSTAATRTDSEVLESASRTAATATGNSCKNRDKLALLALMSQMAQSDGDLDEQEPESCGTSEAHYDQRLTHEYCTAFGDLAKLRERPAHFGVVLNYALQNADSTPLLVAAVCDLYRVNCDSGNPKEMKRWATEIYAAFLADRSPLHLPADEALVHSIECVIQSRTERDEPLKQLLQPVAAQSRELVATLLRDFVGVLGRGLGTLYGIQELLGCDTLSRADELRLLEVRLEERTAKLLDNFTRRSDALAKVASNPPPAAALAELQRTACLIHALLTVARLFALPMQLGALQTAADRFPSFCTKNKRLNLKRYATKLPAASYAHQFLLMQFASQPARTNQSTASMAYPTCALCGLSLWTVGAQGLQCAVCDVTVHCECARFATEPCPFARAASLAPANSTVSSVTPTNFGTLPNQIGILKEREKDAKRPRSVNVISALPNIIRKNLNLPGGATLSKEAKKHPTILQSNTASVDDSASPTGLTSQLQSFSQSVMSGLASPADVVSPPPLPATSPPPVSALSSYEKLDDSDQFGLVDSHGSPAQTGRLSSLDSSLSIDSDGTFSHKRSRSTLPIDVLKFRATSVAVKSEQEHDGNGPSDAKLASCIDTELEVDNDKPLETLLGRELYASLKKRERERQQAIHELITTELSHVRWLIVLQRLFHAVWPPEFAELRDLLMPNVGDVLELHRKFAQALRESRDTRTQLVNSCGPLLNSCFSQEHLAEWTTVPARFCSMHFLGIERLRKLRHKEAALDRALSAAEADPLCRRKQLTDLLACEMQRITKYTMLLERVLKPTAVLATDGDQAMATEAEGLRSAIESARLIAAAVNTYVRDRQNAHVLTELARRIDDRMSAADAYYHTTVGSVEKLARRRLLFEGTLKWHISKQRAIDVRCVLLESVLLLLQVVDDKFVLKVHSAAPTVDRLDRFVCSPIVPLQHVHVREDAADKRLFYVLNRDKGHSVMYDLVAPSHDERKKWIAHITEAAEAVKLQQITTLGVQSGLKRKITLALRADTHSDAAGLPGDRRSLARTISANDTQALLPASEDADASNGREADANVDADASPAQAISESYQANQPVVVDVQEHDALGDGNFSQERMTSLRATLRKHNVKGFDDTFLDTFAQPSAVGDAPAIVISGDRTAPTDGNISDDDALQHARARALGRRRSSLSELEIHTCNAQCSLISASVVEPIRELRELCDAEVDSHPDDCATRSESDDEADVNVNVMVPADTESESLPPTGPLSSPPDFISEHSEPARPMSRMSNRSVTPVESDSTNADKLPAPVQQQTNADVTLSCTDVAKPVSEAVVDSDASSASKWTIPTSNVNRQAKLGESESEVGNLAVDNANRATSPSAPTRVIRSVSRNVRTEKHVLRVDEAERIAKQIAKHDRTILDGLNERQRLLTAFLTLQRNLMRATSLNAEARTRINSLQPVITSGEQQSLMQRLPEDQHSRAVSMRSLIENALKQAKSVLEFMTTYQPVTGTTKDTGSAKPDTTSANGIGMYSAMPLGDALRIVDGVNQSLLELITLFENARSHIEAKPNESANLQATEGLASGGGNSKFVALSSRSVVLDKVSRMVSAPHELQTKPLIVVEPKLAGVHDDTITDLPSSYFEAIARVSQSTNERREHLVVYERVRIISSVPTSSSIAVSKRQTDAVTHRQ